MRCAPEEEEFDRDERTLDVICWLLPVGAGVAVGLPVLFGVAALLGVDGDLFFTMLIVGLPAIATVVFGVRHSFRTGEDDFGIDRHTRRSVGTRQPQRARHDA